MTRIHHNIPALVPLGRVLSMGDAVIDRAAVGRAREASEAERVALLKEDRRARPTNEQLLDAMSYWTEDDLLAICRARRKCDPLLLAQTVNAAIDKFLDDQVEAEVAEEVARACGCRICEPRRVRLFDEVGS